MKKTESKHQKSENRQKDILQAALACFTEMGYDSASISDICSSAGASVGSLYHHFGSKEQLAAQLYVSGIETYQTGILAALQQHADPRETVAAVIRYHLWWVEHYRDWAVYLSRMRHAPFMFGTEGELRRLNQSFGQTLSQWFNQQQQAKTIRPMNLGLFIALLLGPVQEYTRLYLAGVPCTPLEEAAAELSRAAWLAMRNDTA